MNAPLHVEHAGAHVVLTLNRPGRRNALSRELIAALTAALRAAEQDDAVRCILLTGAPPAFCAGLDLHEVAETPPDAVAHDTSALLTLYETMDAATKPLIAAVNGPAAAGGAALLAACDIVICAASARIGYPGIRHGLVAPIVMPSLVRQVGRRRATYLLLSGQLISAAEAVAYGLANEVVPDERLATRVREVAEMFAAHPSAAVAETKALLRRFGSAVTADETRRLAASVPLSDEARAGLRRFLGL